MILAALGDSLCGGYLLDGKFVDDANASYPALIAQHYGATQLGIVAFPGAPIESVMEGVERLPVETDLLIVNAGTNNMVVVASELQTIDDAVAVFTRMVAQSRAHMPNARIVVVGIRNIAAMDPDAFARPHAIQRLRHRDRVHAASVEFNARILSLPDTTPVALAGRAGADSIELFPDAIHPSPLGVRWIADAVLEAMLPKPT